MPPSKLLYEGSTVYAQPTFRVIVVVDMPLSAAPMRQAMHHVLDLFTDAAGARLTLSAHSGGKVKSLKPKAMSANVMQKARTLIDDAAWEWPSTLRFYGQVEDPYPSVAPPHLRFEQFAETSLIQIELPPDGDELIAFADHVTTALRDLPVLWGVMGFGMFQLETDDSLIWMLPRVTPRYKCAIEVQPNFARSLLRRVRHMDELRLNQDPVMALPDLGWRTLVGSVFYDRLPNLADLASVPKVTLDRATNFVAVTAGNAPVWGDVNLAEDIAPFREVGRALHPVRPAWERTKNALFGGYENDNGLDRIEAWYERFAA